MAVLAFTTSILSADLMVTDITATEWNSLISAHDAAWSVVYRGGGTSGAGAEEIRLTRYLNEGIETLIGNVTWSPSNNDLQIWLDASGNISARANATIVSGLNFATVRPYNQILIRVYDESPFGNVSDLQDIEINGHEVRKMFADGNGFPGENDIVSVHNFGSQAPFSWNGAWSTGISPSGDQQYVWIVALQNDSIPQPPPTPPHLSHHWTPSGFELTAGSLVAGRVYRVMGSPDLSDWTPRHTFTAANPPEPHHWTAPLSPTGREFFRLEWDP